MNEAGLWTDSRYFLQAAKVIEVEKRVSISGQDYDAIRSKEWRYPYVIASLFFITSQEILKKNIDRDKQEKTEAESKDRHGWTSPIAQLVRALHW